jgi:Tfp pilus assembly protein FimT
VVEILITVAVIGIVSGMGYPALTAFIQEQRLSRSAEALMAYLQSARARAERLATNNSTCQLTISGITIGPSAISNNICAGIPSLNLAQASGITGLTLTMDQNMPNGTTYPITFNRSGTLAAEILAGTTTSVLVSSVTPMPRLIYLSASGTQQQRCVFLDMVSIRLGWRSGSSGVCTYAAN